MFVAQLRAKTAAADLGGWPNARGRTKTGWSASRTRIDLETTRPVESVRPSRFSRRTPSRSGCIPCCRRKRPVAPRC